MRFSPFVLVAKREKKTVKNNVKTNKKGGKTPKRSHFFFLGNFLDNCYTKTYLYQSGLYGSDTPYPDHPDTIRIQSGKKKV